MASDRRRGRQVPSRAPRADAGSRPHPPLASQGPPTSRRRHRGRHASGSRLSTTSSGTSRCGTPPPLGWRAGRRAPPSLRTRPPPPLAFRVVRPPSRRRRSTWAATGATSSKSRRSAGPPQRRSCRSTEPRSSHDLGEATRSTPRARATAKARRTRRTGPVRRYATLGTTPPPVRWLGAPRALHGRQITPVPAVPQRGAQVDRLPAELGGRPPPPARGRGWRQHQRAKPQWAGRGVGAQQRRPSGGYTREPVAGPAAISFRLFPEGRRGVPLGP